MVKIIISIKLKVLICSCSDFDIPSSVANFQSMIGTQKKCTYVNVTQDLIDEDDEMFLIFAFSIDPATGFSNDIATLTVIDDDGMSTHAVKCDYHTRL